MKLSFFWYFILLPTQIIEQVTSIFKKGGHFTPLSPTWQRVVLMRTGGRGDLEKNVTRNLSLDKHSPLEKFSWPRILSPISVCLLSQNPQNLGFRNATKSRAATRPIRTFAFSIFSSDAIFSHQQRAENETEDAVRTSVERQWQYTSS